MKKALFLVLALLLCLQGIHAATDRPFPTSDIASKLKRMRFESISTSASVIATDATIVSHEIATYETFTFIKFNFSQSLPSDYGLRFRIWLTNGLGTTKLSDYYIFGVEDGNSSFIYYEENIPNPWYATGDYVLIAFSPQTDLQVTTQWQDNCAYVFSGHIPCPQPCVSGNRFCQYHQPTMPKKP